eukprot:CAMPEP_0183374206 /NCGR_PEP_ID=MMETSP0164_2-20130417/113774_1 /TAXON_ID=221442 /ORGANISM="Coccolithus pelagicus ssp braarudi, Strain PLY182g" /LENGTH=64 /DNA_ID=CAMNT_0025551217 /DNA_START=45 /DNA_END=239 /DNA_ORIENTATION=+
MAHRPALSTRGFSTLRLSATPPAEHDEPEKLCELAHDALQVSSWAAADFVRPAKFASPSGTCSE